MSPNQETLFNWAIDFLDNGGELPQTVTNRGLAALLKQVHSDNKLCYSKIEELTKKVTDHNTRIEKMEQWTGWIKLGSIGAGIVSMTAIILAIIDKI